MDEGEETLARQAAGEAVTAGQFHVHAIETIDEGIELLTGVRAGNAITGGYEEGTVHGLVDDKLAHFAEHLKEFSDGDDDEERMP